MPHLMHMPTARFEGLERTDDPAAPIMFDALVLPYGVTVPLNRWGDTVSFAQDAVTVADGDAHRVKFLLDHREKPFGYGVSFTNRDGALWGRFAIPRDELGDPEVAGAVRQMRNGVRDAVSVGIDWSDDDVTQTVIGRDWLGDLHHHDVAAATLLETSTVVIPRFADARHAPLAASAPTDPDDPDDPDDTDDTDEPKDPDMATDTDTDTDLEASRVAAHRATTGQPVPPGRGRRNMGAFAFDLVRDRATAVAGDHRARLQAALTDELSTDVPGLVHDMWLSQVVQIVQVNTPTVQAFSRLTLPDSGMVVHLPVVQNMPPLGQQTTEKSQVASGKFTVNPASFNVNTYAGGQDVSIQTLQRSDPQYLQVLMAAWSAEMGAQLELFAATTVAGGATPGGTWPGGIADMADPFVDVAATMLGAVGRLPEVAVLAPDVWSTMAKAKDTTGRHLFPALAPVNASGTSDVTSSTGSVSGLTYYVSAQMPAGTGVVGVREAFATMIGAPIILGPVPNVTQAGYDVGIAVFAACGITDARGVYKITGTLPVPTGAAATSPSATRK